jgi:hypothetical protein
MAAGHAAHLGKIPRAAALDHVAGDGKRAAGETDQGRRPDERRCIPPTRGWNYAPPTTGP